MKGKGGGLDAIKSLALQHGEKLVMLLVVVCAGMLIWSTLSHESLPQEKSANRLTTKANQVRSTVDNYTWDQAIEQAPEEVRIHESIKSAGAVEIAAEPYLPTGALAQEIVERAELRKDPKLLPVIDFEGHGVTGLLGFIDEEVARERELQERRLEAMSEREREQEREKMANEENTHGRNGGFDNFGRGENENRRAVSMTMRPAGVELNGDELIRQLSCAVVMAKVPLPEQLEEYKKALAKTRTYNPSEDYPKYFGYLVQRAEVTGEGELEWKRISFPNGRYNGQTDKRRTIPNISTEAIDRITYNWARGLEDFFDPRYADPALTVPLAPLVGRNWDEMAYLSEVPLAADVEAEMEDTPEEFEPEEGAGDELVFGDRSQPGAGRRPGGGRFGSGEFGGEFGGMGGPRPPRRGGGSRGGRGMGSMGGEFGGGGMARTGGGTSFDENGEMVVDIPFLMLRFFDLSVKPGKRYKYRVQLVMADPNFSQLRDHLDPSVLERERKPTIYGEWSEPSPTISIPQAGIVRVAESDPPRSGYYAEPQATMLVESFGIDERGNATQASKEIEARRGAVMNFQGEVEALVERGRFIEKLEDFTLDTGIVVLDLQGGKTLSRELKEPTHALLMDASGRMYMRDELDDELEVAIHRAVFEESDDRTGPGGGRGRDFGGGEFGGGEFGF